MTLNSLKELDKLMLLCKRRGVQTIKIDNIEFTIIPDHTKAERPKRWSSLPANPLPANEDTPGETIDTPDELTEEQLLMWSTGGQQ